MMAMLNKMKDKLERESNDHKQARLQVGELTARLQQLSSVRSTTFIWEIERLPHTVTIPKDPSFTIFVSLVRAPVFQEDLL